MSLLLFITLQKKILAENLCSIFSISLIESNQPMKKTFFKLLSKANKKVLPSYSKKQLDLQKAGKLQKAIIGWKLWVTKNSLKN